MTAHYNLGKPYFTKRRGGTWEATYTVDGVKATTPVRLPDPGRKLKMAAVVGALTERMLARQAAEPKTPMRACDLVTFEDVCERYIEVGGLATLPATRDKRAQRIRNHIVPALGRLTGAGLDVFAIQGYVADLSRKPGQAQFDQAASTLHKRYIGILKTDLRIVCKNAHAWGFFGGRPNPMRGYDELTEGEPRPGVEPAETRVYSLDDRDLILDHIATHHDLDTTMVAVMILGAPRQAEMRALLWSHIDRNRGRYGEMFVPGTKTKAGKRWVPLDPRLRDALDRYQAAVGEAGAGYVFGGRTPFSKNMPQRAIGRVTAAVGVEALAPHDLRRTCSSAWLEDGWSPAKVARWLGQSGTRTLHNHYEKDMGGDVDLASPPKRR